MQLICSKQGAAVVRRGIGRVLCRKRLADANNHLSRESKMSSTGIAYYSRVACPQNGLTCSPEYRWPFFFPVHWRCGRDRLLCDWRLGPHLRCWLSQGSFRHLIGHNRLAVLPSLAWRNRRTGFLSRHRQPGMGSDPIDSIFLGGEFSKVVHDTIRPCYQHSPNLAVSHRQ